MVCRDDWCSVWSSCMSMTSTVIQFHLIVVSVTGPRWGFPYILCLHSFSTHYPTYINFLLEIFLIRMNRLDHVSNMREVEFVTFVLQCIQSSYDMCMIKYSFTWLFIESRLLRNCDGQAISLEYNIILLNLMLHCA